MLGGCHADTLLMRAHGQGQVCQSEFFLRGAPFVCVGVSARFNLVVGEVC